MKFSEKQSTSEYWIALAFVMAIALWTSGTYGDTQVLGVQDVRDYEIRDSGYLSVRSANGIAGGGVVYWIDDSRVLFAGNPTSAKKTADANLPLPESLPQLYVWDIKTNKIAIHHVDNPAWGKFWGGRLCVYESRVWFNYYIDSDGTPQRKRNMRFEGPFGKERLSEYIVPPLLSKRSNPSPKEIDLTGARKDVQQKPASKANSTDIDFNYLTCEEYQPSKLPRLAESVSPLLPGEYVIREYKNPEEQLRHSLPLRSLYVAKGGKRTPLILGDQPVGVSRYFRYLDSYLVEHKPSSISEKVLRRYGLLDRSGNIKDYTPPSGPWMNSTVYVAPTKRGMFLASKAQFASKNGAAGGYLLLDGRFVRVIAGFPQGFDISPSGCRIAMAISDRIENDGFDHRIKMLDICSKGE